MQNIPTWVRVIAVAALLAAVYGAAQVLLWADRLSS